MRQHFVRAIAHKHLLIVDTQKRRDRTPQVNAFGVGLELQTLLGRAGDGSNHLG